jgi:hypothetical protein
MEASWKDRDCGLSHTVTVEARNRPAEAWGAEGELVIASSQGDRREDEELP